MIYSEKTSKDNLYDRTNELKIQEKIVNKTNRNDDSYRVNESIFKFNIDQLEYSNFPTRELSFATPNTKQFFDLVNKSRKSTNTIPKTPNLPQKDINGDESVRRIIESETFNDNVFEEMKIENLKTKNNFLE